MKKTIIIFLLGISVGVSAQTKDSVFVLTADRTEILSISKFINSPNDVSENERKRIVDWFNKNLAYLPKELFAPKTVIKKP